MNIAILSPYRKHDESITASAETSALHFVTEALAHHVANDRRDVFVVTPRPTRGAENWSDGNVSIVEVPRCVGIFAFLKLTFGVPGSCHTVHFEHEVFAYGGFAVALTMPIALALLRMRGHRILTTLHGVLPLAHIDQKFMASYGVPTSPWFVRFVWRHLIREICRASTTIHVHEERQRQLLREEYGIGPKIVVVPLGVDDRRETISRGEARKHFEIDDDAEVVTFFGFLYRRKGIVELLQCAREMLESNPDRVLVIAGTLPDRAGDAAEVNALLEDLKDCSRFLVTGFLSDDRVPSLMTASDAVILPYTFSMSASGPVTIAAAYGTPLLLSDRFADHFPDYRLFFSPTPRAIREAIDSFFSDASRRRYAEEFSRSLSVARSWKDVSSTFLQLYRALDERSPEKSIERLF
ncbi:MAG: hypothetical protein NVS2B3_05340 [Vulcanimicrobiaceae bacterium]